MRSRSVQLSTMADEEVKLRYGDDAMCEVEKPPDKA
jgi:hypothetical protein